MSAIADIPAYQGNYRHQLARGLAVLQFAYLVLIWPLLFSDPTAAADLVTGPMPEPQVNPLNRVFFPLVASLAMVLLIAERHRMARFHFAGLITFGGMVLYLALSAAWALAPSVTLFKFALIFMQITILAVGVLLASSVEDIVRPLFWVMAAVVVINLAAIVLLPTTPIGHPGIYGHKNTLGAVATLSGYFALYGITRTNWRVRATGAFMLVSVLFLLVISQSKTSLALFIMVPFAALIAVGLYRYVRIALPITLIVVFIPVAAVMSGVIPGFSFNDISSAVSSDGTFTGRTVLWDFALRYIAERPVQGYGYQSFWGIGDLSPAAKVPESFLQRTPHAHNGYFDLILQGGIILLGLFLALLMMVSWWLSKLIDADARLGFFATTLFLYLTLLNLMETIWLKELSTASALTLLLILFALTKYKNRPLT